MQGHDDTEREIEGSRSDRTVEPGETGSVEAQAEERGQGCMKLTDPEAIKALKKVRVWDLAQMIDDYPEDERDGRSDWDMVANEAGWLLDALNEDGNANHDALLEAREIIRTTKNGTVFPGLLTSAQLKSWQYRVQDARDFINMYNRLVRFVAKLKGMGLSCPYC